MSVGNPFAVHTAEQLAQLGIEHDLDLKGTRDGFDGHVIVRGSHAAAREHDIEPVAQRPHFLGQDRDIVGQHQHTFEADAQGTQRSSQLGHVRVADLAAE